MQKNVFIFAREIQNPESQRGQKGKLVITKESSGCSNLFSFVQVFAFLKEQKTCHDLSWAGTENVVNGEKKERKQSITKIAPEKKYKTYPRQSLVLRNT